MDNSIGLAIAGSIVPAAHFIYSVIRDFVRSNASQPQIAIRICRRTAPGPMGCLERDRRYAIVTNTGSVAVSVVEVRTCSMRGHGVFRISSDPHSILPGCAECFHVGSYDGEVFVELGTGDVFSSRTGNVPHVANADGGNAQV